MFCGKCGTSIPDNAEFCFKCGTPVPAQAKVEVEPTVQQAVPQPIAVQPEVKPVTNTAKVEKKKSKKPFIIGIVAGAVVLIGIIVALCVVFLGDDGNEATEPVKKEEEVITNDIVGTWYMIGVIDCYKSSDEDYPEETTYIQDDDYPEYIFDDDGNYSFSTPDGSISGTYELDDDILTINTDGETWESKLLWEDDRLLLIEYYDGEIGDDVYILVKDPSVLNTAVSLPEAENLLHDYLNNIVDKDFRIVAATLDGTESSEVYHEEFYCEDIISNYWEELESMPMSESARNSCCEIYREWLYTAFDTVICEVDNMNFTGDTGNVYFTVDVPDISIACMASTHYNLSIEYGEFTAEELLADDEKAASLFRNSLYGTEYGTFSDPSVGRIKATGYMEFSCKGGVLSPTTIRIDEWY